MVLLGLAKSSHHTSEFRAWLYLVLFMQGCAMQRGRTFLGQLCRSAGLRLQAAGWRSLRNETLCKNSIPVRWCLQGVTYIGLDNLLAYGQILRKYSGTESVHLFEERD
jgi:hypothetical protein